MPTEQQKARRIATRSINAYRKAMDAYASNGISFDALIKAKQRAEDLALNPCLDYTTHDVVDAITRTWQQAEADRCTARTRSNDAALALLRAEVRNVRKLYAWAHTK